MKAAVVCTNPDAGQANTAGIFLKNRASASVRQVLILARMKKDFTGGSRESGDLSVKREKKTFDH